MTTNFIFQIIGAYMMFLSVCLIIFFIDYIKVLNKQEKEILDRINKY